MKPEYAEQKPKKQRKSKRVLELEKEVEQLQEELERVKEDAREESTYCEECEANSEIFTNWDFAQSELQEILDNMKYRKRVYEQAELRKIIEEILR